MNATTNRGGYDSRITDIARIAAIAAGRNARAAPWLLMADITFTLADAVEDGRLILGPAQTMSAGTAETKGLRAQPASVLGIADAPDPHPERERKISREGAEDEGCGAGEVR